MSRDQREDARWPQRWGWGVASGELAVTALAIGKNRFPPEYSTRLPFTFRLRFFFFFNAACESHDHWEFCLYIEMERCGGLAWVAELGFDGGKDRTAAHFDWGGGDWWAPRR